MRKASVLVLIAVLTVSLIGCSQKADEASGDELVAPTSSFSAGESTETPEVSEKPTSAAEPQETISSAVSEQPTTAPVASQETSTTPAQQPTTSKPSGGQSTSTQPPAPTSKPTEPPQPTDPPPVSTPTPAFDPQPYVDYAKEYGASIGLKYEPRIGTGAWNAPQNLYASLTDESMRKGIRSGCDILITEGFEYFYPVADKQADGSYKLYIYYG
jgi:hypothetical protein